ncbi:MAG: hypothetical protein EZS28_008731 [Streblomastix strix]|uniref:Uncharacterized protein n=1 Tax=Streblomastix strix TaxID=222440 RepID=A0A5J4WLP7_9EUKA|nr:MAG: hypothetical protein EZS28_008731 [Streblomastix strix]
MHNLSLSHVAYGYDDPNSHIHSAVSSAFEVQQVGQIPPALGSPFIRHGQFALDYDINSNIHNLSFRQVAEGYDQELMSQVQSEVKDPFTQYAGHSPLPALGSPVDLHSHLELGIPPNNVGSVGHLHPYGELVPVHSHESFGTVQLEEAEQCPFSVLQVEQGQLVEFESQMQSVVGQFLAVQQAGHFPPARGSALLKHGQSDLDQLIRSNLHFLSITQTDDEQDEEFESHTHSDVRFPFTQYAGHFPPALGSAELKHEQSVVV